MTSHNKSECRHCGIPYWYQASGGGWGREDHKDATYCQSCKRVIDKALGAIPRKCQRRWIESKGYTFAELVAFEKEREEWAKNNGGLFGMCRRVAPCLFDLDDPSNQHIVRIVPTPLGTFGYSYWTNKPDDVKITKEVHWDIINDHIVEPQDAEIVE